MSGYIVCDCGSDIWKIIPPDTEKDIDEVLVCAKCGKSGALDYWINREDLWNEEDDEEASTA